MPFGQLATATVTGITGPASTMTAVVFSDVRSFNVDCLNNVLSITHGSGQVKNVDISADATLTWTVSGNKYTLTVAA